MKYKFLLISLFFCFKLNAFLGDYKANKAFIKGDFETAKDILEKKQIEEPNDPLINYNLGTIYYRLNNLESAQNSFQRAIDNFNKENIDLKEQAFFNMGNIFYKNSLNFLGADWENKKLEEKDKVQAISLIQKSIENYKSALNINKNNKTEHNLKTAEEVLKKLQKQDNKDKNNKDNKNQNKQDNQDNNEKEKKEQQNSKSQNKETQDQNSQEKEQAAQEQRANEQKSQDLDQQKTQEQKTQEQKVQEQEKQSLKNSQLMGILDNLQEQEKKTAKKKQQELLMQNTKNKDNLKNNQKPW